MIERATRLRTTRRSSRQQILESRGWRIHRIWSTDWFNRRSAEEHRLLDALQRAETAPQSKPVEHAPAPPGPDAGPPPAHGGQPRAAVLYKEANFKMTSELLPHEAPRKVQEAVRRIVDIEGPIHAEEVARRLATVWGLDRAGSRIWLSKALFT